MLSMKKIVSLIVFMLAMASVFGVIACGSTNGGGGGTQTRVTYEVAVDAKNATIDTDGVSVCIYSTKGTAVEQSALSQGKAVFELPMGRYVATLSGLSEEVSYSSALLTENNNKATITLDKSDYDEFADPERSPFTFAFTVILLVSDVDIDNLFVQVCDDNACIPVWFEDGNIADVYLNVGNYYVKAHMYADEDNELYHEDYTVTLDKRFCVIAF